MKWYVTIAVALYAILVFQSAVLLTTGLFTGYAAGQCLHFDYNNHASWSWDWWVRFCSQIY